MRARSVSKSFDAKRPAFKKIICKKRKVFKVLGSEQDNLDKYEKYEKYRVLNSKNQK